MRTLLILFVLVALPAAAVAAPRADSPDLLVDTFLSRDLDGGRISPYSRQGSMADLVAWGKEPNWKVLVVVEGYKPQSVRRTPNGLQATVEYQVLGELVDGTWVPRGQQRLERKHFQIIRQNDHWKVSKPILPPHISLPRAIAELKAMLGKLSGSGNRQHLRRSLAALEDLNRAE